MTIAKPFLHIFEKHNKALIRKKTGITEKQPSMKIECTNSLEQQLDDLFAL